MNVRNRFVVVAFLALGLAGGTAYAGLIVQDEWNGRWALMALSPGGQSFTAEDALISVIGFGIQDMNPGNPLAPVIVTLCEGVGAGGPIVGTAECTPPEGVDYPAFVDFDFSSVALIVGQPYTALLDTTSWRWGLMFETSDDLYPGGAMIEHGVPHPEDDARFHVVPQGGQIPEPATLSLVAVGLLALARRRR